MSNGSIKRAYRLSLQVVCASLLSVALLPQLLPQLHADEWNKSTKFTFTDPVQIPGTVLPPGSYVFRLLNSFSDRHIVQVWDEDKTHLLATVLAIPDYRLTAKDASELKFEERHLGTPDAVKEWFYPGDNFGQEFVYPKGEALQTAEVTPPPAPVTTTAPPEGPELPPAAAGPSAPVEETPQASQPEQQPTPPAASTPAPEPAPEEAKPSPFEPESLPKTGSEMPLIGLLGFSSLGSGLLVRILRRR